ncbi:SDR family oxidoreductase [Clostridium manihotivorum]|uniref:Short-chain dehydrogenase n=1 Tax=Clostridium manihotivorum TaxID=2320868 RepID=A0A410DVE7_9CLOT|nr:SDR family oxidoreductase [Clostridium manihotivorum]QAA32958.1 short-chain dehydrogenase [Clostridium manihotivorum]
MKLTGNTILITGGATGIGYSLAENLIKLGNEVIICGRREDKLFEAKKAIPNLHIKVCDVAKDGERLDLFKWVTSNFESLNIIINNAGIQRDIDFKRGIDDLLDGGNEIAINLEAPIYLTALFVPFLMKQESAAIINVSSGLGFTPLSRVPVYCATKAGLHSFTMTLRHQLSDTKIKVFEIIPPAVDTELNIEARKRLNFTNIDLKPNEFTLAVLDGIENDIFEIGYGSSAKALKSSKQELDTIFQIMNKK